MPVKTPVKTAIAMPVSGQDTGQEARLKVPSSLRRSTGSCTKRSVSCSSFSSASNLHMRYIYTNDFRVPLFSQLPSYEYLNRPNIASARVKKSSTRFARL